MLHFIPIGGDPPTAIVLTDGRTTAETYIHEKPFVGHVRNELDRARTKHPKSINSAHEGLAVLLEEVEEVKVEVFKRRLNVKALYAELVQVAAMAQRIAEDLSLSES